MVRPLAIATFLAVATAAGDGAAVEDRLHFGLDAGFATSSFPAYQAAGFDGGAHALYGISDAFNLRVGADVGVYDLPDPDTSALVFGAMTGAEYVLDTIDWVIYAGLTLGPTLVSVQSGADTWMLGLEIPGGVSYLLSDRFALRLLEVRYRLHFFGDDTTPGDQLYLGAGLQIMAGL